MQACPIRRGPSSSSLSADPQGGRQAPLTLHREFLESHAKYRKGRGEIAFAAVVSLGSLELPLPVSAILARRKATPDIKLASDITWFLYNALLNGDEQHATVTAACHALAAKRKPGLDVSAYELRVQRIWRRYRQVAHLCAARHAFRAENLKGYVHILAVAEALLDSLNVRKRTSPQLLLDRATAWTVPRELGLLKADLDITPVDMARLLAP
jgi:hypothetical protein